MSQEKVNKNKKTKANRKALVRKKKIEYVASLFLVAVIAVAVVGWICYSVYNKVETAAAENITYTTYELSTDAISSYTSTLN